LEYQYDVLLVRNNEKWDIVRRNYGVGVSVLTEIALLTG
jgi:hypothetical protein